VNVENEYLAYGGKQVDNFENFVIRSIKALNECNIEYVIIGGLTAIKYGRPRSTMDIDVIVRITPKQRKLIEALIHAFNRYDLELDLINLEASLLHGDHVPVFDKSSPYRIDLKTVNDKLDMSSLKNRRIAGFFGVETWIESPEDLIIAKLVYGEQQDEEDVLAVILAQKDDLNIPYLQKRSEEERVSAKLFMLYEELDLPKPW